MSMRHWDPSLNGHDHFFATFSRFNLPSKSRTGDMLAEVASRAAAEHVSYLELMITPDGGTASRRGRAAGWDPDLGRQRDKLLAAGFSDAVVGEVRKQLDAAEARRNELLACGTPKADPGCLRHDSLHLAGRPRRTTGGGVRTDSRRLRERPLRIHVWCRSIWSSRRTIRPRSATSRCTCR